jgi:hypothetical protein
MSVPDRSGHQEVELVGGVFLGLDGGPDPGHRRERPLRRGARLLEQLDAHVPAEHPPEEQAQQQPVAGGRGLERLGEQGAQPVEPGIREDEALLLVADDEPVRDQPVQRGVDLPEALAPEVPERRGDGTAHRIARHGFHRQGAEHRGLGL